MSIRETLAERGSRYGSFDSHSKITQDLKRVLRMHGAYHLGLNDSQREALDMIMHKVGRILNGDPNYADSWHDIAGYAMLVEKEINLKGEKLVESKKPEDNQKRSMFTETSLVGKQ